jgi:alkylated DNA repair dioxygenase AlkB
MSKTSSSILNHFKRKAEVNPPDSSPKRQKIIEPSISVAPKPTSKPLKGDLKFTITPPDFDLETSQIPGREIKKKPDLDLILFKPFLSKPCAKQLYKYLLEALPWYKVFSWKAGPSSQVIYKRGPLTITTPRYTTVFGRDEISPPETKYKRTPRPIPPALLSLKKLVEQHTYTTYNFCLINFYSSGKDSISYHSDDEHFLGPLPTYFVSHQFLMSRIASLSLGGEREFYLKNKADNKLVEKYLLQNGDMIVMQNETQSKWLHAIPKRAHAEPRIKYFVQYL